MKELKRLLGSFMQNNVNDNLNSKTCWYKKTLEQTLAPMTLRVGYLNPSNEKLLHSNSQQQRLLQELIIFIANHMYLWSKEAVAEKIYAAKTPIIRFVSSQVIDVEQPENIEFEKLSVSLISQENDGIAEQNSISYSPDIIVGEAYESFISKQIVMQSDVIIVNGIGVSEEHLNEYIEKVIIVSADPCFVIFKDDNSFDFIQVKSAKIEHVNGDESLFGKLTNELKEILLFDSLLDEHAVDGLEHIEATLKRITEYSAEDSLSYQQCEADFEYQGPITNITSTFSWKNIFKSFVDVLSTNSSKKSKATEDERVQEKSNAESGMSNLSQQKNSDNCHQLFAQFLRADHLAIQYANAHRSSFIIIYWLGAFALINAAIAIAFSTIGWLALTSAILEFLALVSIYWVYRNDHKKKYHIKWLEYRSLAEMLRMTPLLNSLGMTLSAEGFERHRRDNEPDIIESHSTGRTWLIIYTESLMRSINFDHVIINQEHLLSAKQYLKNKLIRGQISYHQKNAKKMHVVGCNLGSISYLLFVLAFIFVSGKLMTKFIAALHLGIDYQLLSHIGHGLGVLAAICPMLGSAAFAIRNHAEFDISSQRSLAMQKQLKQQDKNLHDMKLPTDFEALIRTTIQTSVAMQSETADWLEIYQVKETEPG